jgi:hypothetical protein
MTLPYEFRPSGDVALTPNGLVRCRGNCSLSTSTFPVTITSPSIAFSFEFCSISPNSDPSIAFGLSQPELPPEHTFSFFEFLQELRSTTAEPHIPFDGIGISIRLFLSAGRMSVYVNDHLTNVIASVSQGLSFFFLRISCEEALVLTSFTRCGIRAFFPEREPRLWTSRPEQIRLWSGVLRAANATVLFSEEALVPLPGVGFRYYEVEVRSMAADMQISIGLAEAAIYGPARRPGHFLNSVGFSTDGDWSQNGDPYPLGVRFRDGDVIGIGVRGSGDWFMTHNGMELAVAGPPLNYEQCLACVMVDELTECRVNFGQLPFALGTATPTSGWALACPGRPDSLAVRVGFLNEPHLLHFFLASHLQPNRDLHILREEQQPGELFEVSVLEPGPESLLGCGYVDSEMPIGSGVGWLPGTIGVHTDDGGLFSADGDGVPLIPPKPYLEDGDSLGMSWRGGAIRAVMNGTSFLVSNDWGYRPFPAFHTREFCVCVLNLGELPFCGSENSFDPTAVALFNRCRVVPTNSDIEEAGLRPGDEVEARDLSFRGRFVGEYRGLFLVTIHGIAGAVPLDVTNPLFVRKLLRVTHRTTPLLRAVMTTSAVVVCESTPNQSTICGMYATPVGIAILIGRAGRRFVLRPITDLFNNESIFVLPNLPRCLAPDLHPEFHNRETCCLDVIETPDHTVWVMMGSLMDADWGMNNGTMESAFSHGRILLRFFGFAFRPIDDCARVLNFGHRKGGRLFHLGELGCEGSVVVPTPRALVPHGVSGSSPLPHVVAFLFDCLNSTSLERCPELPAHDPGLVLPCDWVYTQGDTVESVTVPRIPLIVQSNYH